MVPEAGKWDPEELYVEGSKDANMDVSLVFFTLIPLTLVLWVREAELCVFINELLWMLEFMCLLAIGEQLNCLDIFESIEGLNPETAKLVFFRGVFCDWQEMLLNIYTALESQAVFFRRSFRGAWIFCSKKRRVPEGHPPDKRITNLPALDSSYRRVFVEF